MGEKGSWNRRRNHDKYRNGYASMGSPDCEGCSLGLPKRDGKHYQFGKLHSECQKKEE